MADEDVKTDPEVATAEELSDDERAMEELKTAVELQAEEIGTLRKRLTITVPRSIIDDRLNDQFSERRREETIPGFRRGRAPLKLVEKRFGKEISQELSSRMVLNSYLAVTERDKIKTVGDPMLLVIPPPPKGDKGEGHEPSERLMSVQEGIPHIKLPQEGPLVFKCEVDLQPEFDLPPLDGIEVRRPKIEVSPADVDREIHRLRSLRGHFAPIDADDKIAQDDLLIASFKVKVDDREIMAEENAQFAARDMSYRGLRLTGLGEATVGRKAGETVAIATKIPDEYTEPELRGKDAGVEIVIHDVKRLVLPEVNAEFLENFGCQSEEELRTLIQNEAEADIDLTIRARMREQIDGYLLKNTRLEIPAGISARQTERAVALHMIEKLQQGVPEAEITKEIDSLRTSAAEEVTQALRLEFLMERIAEDRDIHVSEEEVNGVISDIARRRGMRFDRVRDELMKSDRISTLYIRLRNEKIRDALLENAKISD